MESKLPKLAGIRRPMPSSKNVCPMDRIKSAAAGFGSKSATNLFSGSAVSSCLSVQPLSRDVSNIQNSLRIRGRAASPEMGRAAVTHTSRAKLRRSRSACDIRDMRDMRVLKRPDPTLAPIPSKAPRMASNVLNHNNNTSNSTTSRGAFFRKARLGPSTIDPVTNAAGQKNLTITRAPIARLGPKACSKKPAASGVNSSSSSTSISTTGAGKPINKRIPPYDYKARYNDLLEKYKVLKEKYDVKCDQMGNYETLPEQLEESQAQLYTTQEQLRNVQTDNDCLRRQVNSQTLKIDSITDCLGKTKEEFERLQREHHIIKTEHDELSNEVFELRECTANITERNNCLETELIACKEQLFRSNMERKELHNTVLDLRGNIRVFCRVRPPLECEKEKMLCGWNYIDEATVEVQNTELLGKNKTGAHMFNFDYVFHPNSNQEDIFEMVSPLIQSALDGYNICIFAYGQTGSGKTYTMDGIPSNVGVIPRTVELLFDSVNNYKRLGWEYEIKVTFLEIYNEVLYDLLSNEQKDMEIRMAKNNKNDVYVSNITRETVSTAGRLQQLMQIAKMNRATAATVGNDRSSRSHAVTKIELIGTHADKNEMSIGSINLVDLAGSESPKTSIRMNETKNINRSLSELTNVILALLQKQDHIPYRNSKLTHLLMPSLGGNSKTLMFINVAPFLDCYVESVKSLRFAASVNSCKMAKAKRNRILNTSCNNSASLDK